MYYQNPIQSQYTGVRQGTGLSAEDFKIIKRLACYFGFQLDNAGFIPKRKPSGGTRPPGFFPPNAEPGLPAFPIDNDSKASAMIGNFVAHAFYVAEGSANKTMDRWQAIATYVNYNIEELCKTEYPHHGPQY